jgi:phosphoglycolate phosphatase
MPKAILFDLDGTLVDTAPDLVYVINVLRKEQGLPEVPVEMIRPIANLGSKAMIMRAFEIGEDHPTIPQLRQKFLEIYHRHLADASRLFPNIDTVLDHLDKQKTPWGIVTNKPAVHTEELLKKLKLSHRTHALVCGDTLAKAKPYPDPILYACDQLDISPAECLFVGDAATDVLASKAAGMRVLVALYGYINHGDDPYSWNADGYLKEPLELLESLK